MKTKILAIAAVTATAAFSQAGLFQITITNYGPQPLSPLSWSASDASFITFSTGTTSSLGIKKIAEGGDASVEDGYAIVAGASVASHGILGSAPLGPGNSMTGTFSTDMMHDYFSFAAMLGKTNDGFIGESVSTGGLRLYSGSTPSGFSLDIYGARAWDAGTELNTQNAADLGFLGGTGNPADTDNHIRVHGGIVAGVGDSWQQQPAWLTTTKLANITIKPVPEPSTLAATALGATLLLRRRRKA